MKIITESGAVNTQQTNLLDYLNRSFGKKFLYVPALRSELFWAKNSGQHHADLLTDFFNLPDTDDSVDSIAQKAQQKGWKAWAGFWNEKTGELAVYNAPEFGESKMDGLRSVPNSIVNNIAKRIGGEPTTITIIESKEFNNKLERILREHKIKR